MKACSEGPCIRRVLIVVLEYTHTSGGQCKISRLAACVALRCVERMEERAIMTLVWWG